MAYTQAETDALGAKGHAYKNPDGHFSYPVVNASDLADAIRAVGRGGADHDRIRAYVIARAKALGASAAIPTSWAPDGALKVSKVELAVPIWKDDAQQLVYGIVLSPDVGDSQDDVVSAAEIQKTAHRFLTDYRKHDVQHAEIPAAVKTVESFIAPADMEIHGEQVLKGAWVMVTHVSDPQVWERVRKGELTGYSIGGTGVREPAAA